MKKLLIFAAVATMFAACSKDATQDLAVAKPIDKFYATIADNDSRVQLNDACRTVWTSGDRVSVFNKTTGNRRYKFTGNTGDTTGELSYMNGGTTGSAIDKIIAIYPYNASNAVSADGTITTVIPEIQTYCKDSFGVGSSIMVARSDNNKLSFQNVMGWVRIALTGNKVVKSIMLLGNNNEAIAGRVSIDTDLNIHFGYELNAITLDCGPGVQLTNIPTYFYIAVVPQTFSKGFCAEIVDSENKIVSLVTHKSVTIERNHILPMTEAGYNNPQAKPLSNQIWYTTSDSKTVTPKSYDGEIVSNIYSNGKGVITFKRAITSISQRQFAGLKNLTSITIPDRITMIETDAFFDCTNLKSVHITDLDAWLNIRFYSNPLYYAHNLYLNDNLVTNIVIPDSITSIGQSAFSGCTCLASVTIPDRVYKIGSYAFYGCTGLASITIPRNVNQIESYAFRGCTGLTGVIISGYPEWIEEGAFMDCTNLKGFYGKLASDDNCCLINCDHVLISVAITGLPTSYIIPDSVTKIGKYAFYGCTGLTSVTIPDSVTEIGDDAFYDCTGLTSVTIPDSVTSIGQSAFKGCKGLTSVTIPDSVTKINDAAFSGCTSLTNVYCKSSTPPTLGSVAFYNIASSAIIYVPKYYVYKYISANGWKDYSSKIQGYNF